MFYRIGPGEGYEWVFPADDDYTPLEKLESFPQSANWTPVTVIRDKADKRQPGWTADFPWCGFGLVLRRSALDVVKDLLDVSGEVLPLHTNDGVELHIFNARIVPALDEDRSEVQRFPSSGRIMWVEKAVIIADATEALPLFRVFQGGPLFATAAFFERIRDARLSGLTFERVETS